MSWKKRSAMIVAGLMLAASMVVGYLTATTLNQRLSPASVSSPSYLVIKRELFPTPGADQEPHGYVVAFNGAINQTLLLTQGIDETQPAELPLIQGKELQTDEYEWAGVKTKIIYVRSSDKLQIQREIEIADDDPEEISDEPLPRDVLLTLDLPETTAVSFTSK